MKKVLLSGIIITGLIMANPVMIEACQKGATSSCAKCAAKASQYKISKLKKKVTMLWTNQDALEITDDQMAKIKDIKHAAIKELIRLKADKDVVMVDLKSAMWEESMDLGAVNKLIDTKYAAKKKSSKTFVKAINDIQKVLTDKQRAAWKAMAIAQKMGKSSCSKCNAKSSGNFCPLTGKSLDGKGSKGSIK